MNETKLNGKTKMEMFYFIFRDQKSKKRLCSCIPIFREKFPIKSTLST